MATDRELIEHLGGPAKVAELLKYDKNGGVQRVHNWMTRGIPARVKLGHPEIFLRGIQAPPVTPVQTAMHAGTLSLEQVAEAKPVPETYAGPERRIGIEPGHLLPRKRAENGH